MRKIIVLKIGQLFPKRSIQDRFFKKLESAFSKIMLSQ